MFTRWGMTTKVAFVACWEDRIQEIEGGEAVVGVSGLVGFVFLRRSVTWTPSLLLKRGAEGK